MSEDPKVTKGTKVPLVLRALQAGLWVSGAWRGHQGSRGSQASQASQGCLAGLVSWGRLGDLVRR